MQTELPAAANCPKAQATQVEEDCAAYALLAEPGGQAVQEGGEPQYPGGHEATHVAAPSDENSPAPQGKQADREVEPVLVLYVELGHRVHWAVPCPGAYVPTPQATQEESATAPAARPGGQGVQEVAPVPPPLTAPIGQGVHSLAPSVLEYHPVGHRVNPMAPAAQEAPRGQGVHSSSPLALAYVPALHSVHEAEAAGAAEPGVQRVHRDSPELPAADPGGHSVHTLCPGPLMNPGEQAVGLSVPAGHADPAGQRTGVPVEQ